MLGKIASIARGFVWGILLQTYGFHLVMSKCERLEGMHFIDAHNFTTIMLERHALEDKIGMMNELRVNQHNLFLYVAWIFLA